MNSYYRNIILPIVGIFSIRRSCYCHSLCKLPGNEKIVALTFDDGPGENTENILNILRQKNVKASFFCTGKNARENSAVLQRIIADGHTVGSHTENHHWHYTFKGKRAVEKEITGGINSIEAAGGGRTQLFRPPFGITNPAIGYCIQKLQLTSVGWSLRSLDTLCKHPEQLQQKIIRRIRPGDIILLHDRMPCTNTMLSSLIDNIHALNYRFVTLSKI